MMGSKRHLPPRSTDPQLPFSKGDLTAARTAALEAVEAAKSSKDAVGSHKRHKDAFRKKIMDMGGMGFRGPQFWECLKILGSP